MLGADEPDARPPGGLFGCIRRALDTALGKENVPNGLANIAAWAKLQSPQTPSQRATGSKRALTAQQGGTKSKQKAHLFLKHQAFHVSCFVRLFITCVQAVQAGARQ